jgi:hypothetical protein
MNRRSPTTISRAATTSADVGQGHPARSHDVHRSPPARASPNTRRPHPCRALVEAAVHANRQTAPDVAVYRAARARRDATVARLIVARKIGKRVYRTLRDLELAAA